MTNQPLTHLLDLSGQVALITGANRGIGKATADIFGQAGAKVALVARNSDLLADVAATLRNVHPQQGQSETVLALTADVSAEAQVNQAVQQTLEAWGRIDILVNNAGVGGPGPVDQIDLAAWERLMAINLTGAYLCAKAVVPTMKQQGYGRIINISSITAQTGGVSGGVHYSAAKGGMLAMTKTLARDLAPFKVTVNAITPGQIDTSMGRLDPEAEARLTKVIPLGRLGKPEEIAYPTLFLASPMAAYITGATLDVNGGLLKR